jgi:hypothetical protein
VWRSDIRDSFPARVNWAKLKSDGVGMHVELEPPACFVGNDGRDRQPDGAQDWLVEGFPRPDVVSIRNVVTGHAAELGKDHLYDFRTNPIRSKGDARFGFLVLKVQVFIQGDKPRLRPNRSPGESVVAGERIAQLEREAVELRAALRHRRLSEWQHDQIVSNLRGQTFEVWVGTLDHDAEAIALWQDITKALKEAGLKVVAHTSWLRAQGISISQVRGAHRDRLKAAFMAAKIELWDSNGEGAGLPRLEIIVGSKPPAAL